MASESADRREQGRCATVAKAVQACDATQAAGVSGRHAERQSEHMLIFVPIHRSVPAFEDPDDTLVFIGATRRAWRSQDEPMTTDPRHLATSYGNSSADKVATFRKRGWLNPKPCLHARRRAQVRQLA